MDKLALELLKLRIEAAENGAYLDANDLATILDPADYEKFLYSDPGPAKAARAATDELRRQAEARIPPLTPRAEDYLKWLAKRLERGLELASAASRSWDKPSKAKLKFGYRPVTQAKLGLFQGTTHAWIWSWERDFNAVDTAGLTRPGQLKPGQIRVRLPRGYDCLGVRALVLDVPENYFDPVNPVYTSADDKLKLLRAIVAREERA